jgi:hypothetical protein
MSNSTLNRFLHGVPPPGWTGQLSYEENRRRSAEGSRRYWEAERPAREARRAALSSNATADLGVMTDREILIAGAVAYWCEGTKSKPQRRVEQVSFINSDPGLIGFFLRFLDTAGTPRDELIFRVYIHESARIDTAQQFWLDLTGAKPSQFRRPVLKRHNPKTVRKNVGGDYRGCLRIDVRRSGDLYRRIEGWAAAALSGHLLPEEDSNLC